MAATTQEATLEKVLLELQEISGTMMTAHQGDTIIALLRVQNELLAKQETGLVDPRKKVR